MRPKSPAREHSPGAMTRILKKYTIRRMLVMASLSETLVSRLAYA